MRGTFRALPILSIAGTLLGAFFALAVVFFDLIIAEEPLARPLAPYALAVVPALAGAWADWTRLWRPSRGVVRASFAIVISGALLSLACAWTLDAMQVAFVFAPALYLVILLGMLSHRILAALGWRTLSGVVRRDDPEHVRIDTDAGVIELPRGAAFEEVTLGERVSVFARLHKARAAADPFRKEHRLFVTDVIAVADSAREIRMRVGRRIRAWTLFCAIVVLLAFGLAEAGAYEVEQSEPDDDKSVAARIVDAPELG